MIINPNHKISTYLTANTFFNNYNIVVIISMNTLVRTEVDIIVVEIRSSKCTIFMILVYYNL